MQKTKKLLFPRPAKRPSLLHWVNRHLLQPPPPPPQIYCLSAMHLEEGVDESVSHEVIQKPPTQPKYPNMVKNAGEKI